VVEIVSFGGGIRVCWVRTEKVGWGWNHEHLTCFPFRIDRRIQILPRDLRAIRSEGLGGKWEEKGEGDDESVIEELENEPCC